MQKRIRIFSAVALITFISVALLGQGSVKAQQGQLQEKKQEKQERQEKKEKKKKHPVIAKLEQQIAGKEDEPAEKVFKNIQIMKGMPANRVLRIMEHGFSPALGVKCTYCHVMDEWDKDDKAEKQTARKMWKLAGEFNGMLRESIDEKASINCYTCHRGDTTPATKAKKPKHKTASEKDR